MAPSQKLQLEVPFNGPQKHRSCTDVCCLLLFIVFLCAWAAVAYFAYRNGDPEMLILPRDSKGKICGKDMSYKDKPSLFFFDLTKCLDTTAVLDGCKTPHVCVASCPDTSWTAVHVLSSKQNINWSEVQKKLICTDDEIARTVNSKKKLEEVINNNQCAKYYTPMKPFYKRCIPSLKDIIEARKILEENKINLYEFTNGTAEVIKFLDNAQNITKMVIDELYRVRYYILGGIASAILVSIIYIILLRCVSFILVWLSILATFVLLGYGVCYSYMKYDSLEDTKPVSSNETEHFDLLIKFRDTKLIQDNVEEFLSSKDTWFYITIIGSVVFVILLLLVLFLRARIRLAIALIGEASVCISSIKSSLIFPLFPWSIHLVIIIWSLAVGVYLYTLGDSIYRVVDFANDKDCVCQNQYYTVDGQWCTPSKWSELCHSASSPNVSCVVASCKFFNKTPNNFVTYLFLFNIFAYFWSSSFLSALSEMILAATFATWYWTARKRDVPFFVVTTAVFRTIRYHLGTVAFGSLIISICKFIIFLLEYIERKCKKFDNGFTRGILWTLKCFFWCLHNFIAFVNKNAYIMCAIHGGNFCKSAKDAFSLLLRNAIRTVVVDKVSDLLLFLGKVVLTVIVSTGAWFIFSRDVVDADTHQLFLMEFPWAPVIVLGIVTYLISSTFFRVYSMAIDTLFLCFLEDCERNDSSQRFFMSKRLMKLLTKKNVVDVHHHE
uniref:Choline transporter-like protein n=1 Tax=Cacopsylla melanoneura TaxID=428564 RepID=A0A8D8Y9I3_9HEMI